jgi:hypothetical protein
LPEESLTRPATEPNPVPEAARLSELPPKAISTRKTTGWKLRVVIVKKDLAASLAIVPQRDPERLSGSGARSADSG